MKPSAIAARLFDPARHEPLTATPWSETAAREAITRIAIAAVSAFDSALLAWPVHPLDDPETPHVRHHHLYSGGAGVIWALRDLAAQGAIAQRTDFSAALNHAVVQGQADLIAAKPLHGHASYLLGSTGLLLLKWSLERSADVANALFKLIQDNQHNSAREALWGNSGTVLAAIHMAEATGETRWMRLVQSCMQVLLDEMEFDAELGAWVWEQDLYGRRIRYLGAGHGFVGNIYPAFRAEGLLSAATLASFQDRALQLLQRTALHANASGADCLNWPTWIGPPPATGRLPLVQDCHGAPGFICRLANAPHTAEWDEMLLAAGELTWQAGPLIKGASLCHGTPGSAMACLKLWRRFKDPLWLDRARALAMHCIELVERHRVQYGQGRHSLWTGDLGVACVLWNCVVRDDRFPTLDNF